MAAFFALLPLLAFPSRTWAQDVPFSIVEKDGNRKVVPRYPLESLKVGPVPTGETVQVWGNQNGSIFYAGNSLDGINVSALTGDATPVVGTMKSTNYVGVTGFCNSPASACNYGVNWGGIGVVGSGTIACARTTCTGSGTSFSTLFIVGDFVLPTSGLHTKPRSSAKRIVAILDDFHLKVGSAWDSDLSPGTSYAKLLVGASVQGDAFASGIGGNFTTGAGTANNPSIGVRGQSVDCGGQHATNATSSPCIAGSFESDNGLALRVKNTDVTASSDPVVALFSSANPKGVCQEFESKAAGGKVYVICSTANADSTATGGGLSLVNRSDNTVPLYVDPSARNLALWLDAFGVKTPGVNITGGGSTTISTGVGSVKMSSEKAAANVAWIPIQYKGKTYFVPAWATNAP